jgi:hypothetical protein
VGIFKKKQMTRYEQMVASGEMQPMNGLDYVIIGTTVEDVLKNGFSYDNDKQAIRDVMVEIEHIFRDSPEKLDQLKTLFND